MHPGCPVQSSNFVLGRCRNALNVEGKEADSGELELHLAGHTEAGAAKQAPAKALVTQFDVRLQNPAYAYLRAADFRRWESPTVCPNEVHQVVETGKCFQDAVPLIAGAHTHFGLAKKRFFLIPEEERHTK